MAGDDQRYGIRCVGAPHGAGCLGVAGPPRKLSVADSLAERDLDQLSPDTFLKVATPGSQRKIENLAFAGEEFRDLASDFGIIAVAFACAKTEGHYRSAAIDGSPRGAERCFELHVPLSLL